jgi:hypothetical protein
VNAAIRETQDSVMADPDEIRKIRETLAALEGG